MRTVAEVAPSIATCADVLTAAFAHEPTVDRLCGSNLRRRRAWFENLLRTHDAVGGRRFLVTDDGAPVAAAVVTGPGSAPTATQQLAWTGRTLSRCGLRTTVGTIRYLQTTEKSHPEGAWTLEFVGVLPAARGRGVARDLCERAQATYEGAPAFLTTADPRNVDLYLKWGFGVEARHDVLGLNVVAMSRPAI